MPMPDPKAFLLVAGLMSALVAPALAQDAGGIAQGLSERVLFVTSGGYWEEVVEAQSADNDTEQGSENETGDAGGGIPGEAVEQPESGSNTATSPTKRRGYYRLVAIRGQDNRSLVELQQIALTSEGPELALSISLEEINALGAYVTDIRPENSTGAVSQQGFSAFIYLKIDPAITEPETWALFVDEFGDIAVEKSSN